ncbi:hypothetical protein QAD02_011427 [Eretmocerus hayati]|uniref:Uncharacterized protein n=1 Tax=Eretmocerus hayati TaxID=131215 RepID=A0ACC2NYF9_9HYME|nr:hypothetical protein QAD02_011427 [Eretmocerus hayati]
MSSTNNKNRSANHCYGNDQIVVVEDDIVDLDHSGSSAISGEKSFICSFFHEYIKNNVVRVSDVYAVFKEINTDLHMKKIDILAYLLQTDKFKVLNRNQTSAPESFTPEKISPETNMQSLSSIHQETPALIDDVYDSLVNDEDCNDKPPHQSNDSLEEVRAPPSRYSWCNREEATQEPTVSNPLIQKLVEKISSLEDQIKNKDTVISLFDNERGALAKKLEMCDVLHEHLNDLQIKYNILLEENIGMKEEISELKFSKRKLEMMKTAESQTKGKNDVMKNFQTEMKILSDRIKLEYEQKLEKKLKDMKEKFDLIEKTRMAQLFNDILKNLFSSNRNIIVGQCDQAVLAVEVLETVNQWFEETLCSKNFIDTSKWQSRLRMLQKIIKEYEDQYDWLLQQDAKSIAQLELPHIPDPPPEKLGETIKNALAAFYMNQCQVLDAALNAAPDTKMNPINTSPLVGPVKDCWENHRVEWPKPPAIRNGPRNESVPEIELSRYELQDEARALPEYMIKTGGGDGLDATDQNFRGISTPPPDRRPESDICWNCYSSNHVTDDCDQARRMFCSGCGTTDCTIKSCPTCNVNGFNGTKPKQPKSRIHRRSRSRRNSSAREN